MFRIQKLLLGEYKDFKEAVLVETPFAQVNEFGIGLREVQIALTATKLLIAKDKFDQLKTKTLSNVRFDHQDPEIETLELSSMYPLKLLSIKVFRKGSRQLMKISIGASKILWFEFGGHILKNMYWNIWRERISTLNATQATITRDFIPLPSPPYPFTSTTSSEQTIPETQQVVAEVHRGNSESSHLMESSTPSFKVKDLMGSGKQSTNPRTFSACLSRQSRCGCNSAPEVEGCDQELILREVAEYFLETQSDIVMGQHSFAYDSCGSRCQDFLYRSSSIANFMGRWNTSYNDY